jgi:hypothetical protein
MPEVRKARERRSGVDPSTGLRHAASHLGMHSNEAGGEEYGVVRIVEHIAP